MSFDIVATGTPSRCEVCGFGIAAGDPTALTSAGHAHPVCALDALPVQHCPTCAEDRPHRTIPGIGLLCDACGNPA